MVRTAHPTRLMNGNQLYEILEIEKDLVTDFSIFFSRFEYALKRTIKYAAEKNNRINANWDEFALNHDSVFIPERTENLKLAVDYLLAKPPKKQTLKNGTLGWKDVPQQNTPRLQQILCSVRRVRNNLFHGGKFPDGDIAEPGRDRKLLQNCIIILEECLRLNDEVAIIFNDR